jgi:tricarballylate dehydrogenase
MSVECDVLVVGAGNAGLCAALAAADEGAEVIVLERAPVEERGGNSAFTAGAMRVAYDGVDDLRDLMPHLTDDEVAITDFGSYTEDEFFSDIAKVTEYRSDPDMAELLVTRSFETLKWMSSKGVRFLPIYGRQAFKVDGRFKFWGGLTVETNGGGPGLVDSLFDAAGCGESRSGTRRKHCPSSPTTKASTASGYDATGAPRRSVRAP